MATELRYSRPRSSAPEREFAQIFDREIAPHIRSLETQRVEGRAGFITTAIACAAGVSMLLYVLWPLNPGWAAVAALVAAVMGLHLLGSQHRRFATASATWSCRRSAGRSAI
jgi:hypothetical protein